MADATQSAETDVAQAPVSVRAAVARIRGRRRDRHRHGIVGNVLLGVAAVYAAYFGWWSLCLLHGDNRVLAAGGVSVAYLLGSALWRRGWLG
ncbi:hypothetical protein GCM10009839_14260 [Catenulispora yoronensis]|uniref:Uncharacterized protein n=1 Tax=Catenulispora yoronensis TaxID=450799 RepID=A0ABN2TS51_9ACTN